MKINELQIRKAYLYEGYDLDSLCKKFSVCNHRRKNQVKTCPKCKDQIESKLLLNTKCTSQNHKLHISQKSIIADGLCIKCGSPSINNNYLYICSSNKCKAVFWDNSFVRDHRREKREIGKFDYFKTITLHPMLKTGNFIKGHYVYVIYLKKNIKFRDNNPAITHCYYVGKTNIHPYHRLLKHQIGDRPGIRVQTKTRSVYLKLFEGPMSKEQATSREKSLTLELTCPAYSN